MCIYIGINYIHDAPMAFSNHPVHWTSQAPLVQLLGEFGRIARSCSGGLVHSTTWAIWNPGGLVEVLDAIFKICVFTQKCYGLWPWVGLFMQGGPYIWVWVARGGVSLPFSKSVLWLLLESGTARFHSAGGFDWAPRSFTMKKHFPW